MAGERPATGSVAHLAALFHKRAADLVLDRAEVTGTISGLIDVASAFFGLKNHRNGDVNRCAWDDGGYGFRSRLSKGSHR